MRNRGIGFKIIGIIFLSIFFITAVLGFLSFTFSKKRLVSMLGDSLKGVALTATNFINTEDVKTLILTAERRRAKYFPSQEMAFATIYGKALSSDVKFDETALEGGMKIYDRYAELLQNIKRMNNVSGPINVYVKDGRRFKIVLSSESAVLVGSQYKLEPQAEESLASVSATATAIYKDKDGTWISAYAPVNQRMGLIIEVSYKVDAYFARLRTELATIAFACALVSALTAFISYGLVKKSVVSIQRLDDIGSALEKEEYDVAIDIKSDDEIGHLARTFEQLRSSIKKKIGELRLSLAREKKAHLESVIALINAVGLKDPYIRQHLYRVEKYALLIAKKMKIPKPRVEIMRYACYLHDIGKLEVEAALLQKVKLSKDDFDEVKKHSEKGAKIVEGIEFLDEVREIILHHQEHYDGTGYPDALKGEEIPLLARVVAVADALDAMTTDRPYRQKITFSEAMKNIEKDRGVQFDPEACDALLTYRETIGKIAKKHFKM